MTPTAELLTRVFTLLKRARKNIDDCWCGRIYEQCIHCKRLKYDIDGILNNETQGDRP